MNDFVASSVCWTIATSWRTSLPARAGSVATSRSTICAWRTMLVRLWAGPSCIARAISRRRSSCASRSSRDTAGRDPRRIGQPRLGCLGGLGRRHVAVRAERVVVARQRSRGTASGRAACLRGRRPAVSIKAARWVSRTSWALRSAASGRFERRSGRCGRRCGGVQLLGPCLPPGLVPGRLRRRLGDEQVDLDQLGLELRQVASHPPGQLGQGEGWRGRRRSVGHSVVGRRPTISLPASGSSPGASRRPRPGSGR